ncbi:MAG: hypothetical protein ABIN97_14545 [Ginsengibacter sp.]
MDFNYATQISKTIKESKENNVFLSEYKIEDVKKYNKDFVFPIKMVWAEKKWSKSLDSSENEIMKIDTASPPTLIFLLNENDSLNENNYLSKWVLSDADSSSGGVMGGVINLELKENIIPDSYKLTIYRLGSPYDYKNNLEGIADFILKRK